MLTQTNIRVTEISGGILIKKVITLLTVFTHRIVLTIVTNTARKSSSWFEHQRIEVATSGMIIAVTFYKENPEIVSVAKNYSKHLFL